MTETRLYDVALPPLSFGQKKKLQNLFARLDWFEFW